MSVFEYRDYKLFLKAWIERQPKKGHGILKKIADHLRISPTMLTQVMRGDKDFSGEVVSELAEFLGLNEDEFDYLLLLVLYAKAGNFSLRERLKRKIIREQKAASEIKSRVKADHELPDVAKAVFYSNWLYTGIRNMSACPEFQDVDQIAKHLNVSRVTVQKTIEFLLANGLCLEKNGTIVPGPAQTHIAHDSSLVSRHHQNWRMQAFNKMLEPQEKNLFFTAPMSLSLTTAEQIRQRIPGFIEEIIKLVRPSPSEVVRCLNIDWFDY